MTLLFYFSSSLSGLLIEISISPLWRVTSVPLPNETITTESVTYAKISPTAAKTEGSMAPVGGKQNETISKMILEKKEIQKTTFSKFFKFVKILKNFIFFFDKNIDFENITHILKEKINKWQSQKLKS